MRRRLVDAGRAIVESDGVEALSMRRLAGKVGVAPTAIYWHIGGREDLLNAVLDAMIADIPPVAPRGTTPRARVASVARSVHERILATVPTTRLAQHLGRAGELFFPAQVALARELTAAGLHGDDAARAGRPARRGTRRTGRGTSTRGTGGRPRTPAPRASRPR